MYGYQGVAWQRYDTIWGPGSYPLIADKVVFLAFVGYVTQGDIVTREQFCAVGVQ